MWYIHGLPPPYWHFGQLLNKSIVPSSAISMKGATNSDIIFHYNVLIIKPNSHRRSGCSVVAHRRWAAFRRRLYLFTSRVSIKEMGVTLSILEWNGPLAHHVEVCGRVFVQSAKQIEQNLQPLPHGRRIPTPANPRKIQKTQLWRI